MQKYLMGKDDSEANKEFYKLLKEWEESKNQEQQYLTIRALS